MVLSKRPIVKNIKSAKNSMQQRSIILFHSAIKSQKTRQSYTGYLNEFLNFFIIKSFDKLLEIEPKKIQEMLENFVMYESNQCLSLSSVNGKLSALKLFFAMNDVLGLNWIKLNKMKPDRKKPTGDRPYSTKDVQVMLTTIPNLKFRCIIHMLSARCMRIGAFEELQLKHIQDMPNDVNQF